MRLLLASLLLILCVVPHVFANEVDDVFDSIERRDYAAAVQRLREIEASDPRNFASENLDYLLARVYDFSGSTVAALTHYLNAAEREGAARGYALIHLSRIMRETGNLLLERIYLEQLLTLNEPTFSSTARLVLSRNASRTGYHQRAVQILTAVPGSTVSRFLRDDTAMLAEAYIRAGDADRGRTILVRLIDTMPNVDAPDDAALAAVKTLDAMDGRVDLGEAEHLKRAKIYQFNREFAAARLHYEAVIDRYPESASSPSSILEIARGFSQLGEHVEALRSYERVQERYPETLAAKDALLLGSAAWGRVGKYREAITRYQRFIERFPTDERLDRAYLNIVDLLRDQGDDNEALKWAARTRTAFSGKLAETQAIFSEARVFLSRGEWRGALDKLDALEERGELGGASIPGGTTHAEVLFLRGFVLEQLKLYEAAADQYLAIPDGRNEYYGWRATERLRNFGQTDEGREVLATRLATYGTQLKSIRADNRRRRALALIRLADSPDVRNAALVVLRESFAKSYPPPGNTNTDQHIFLILDGVDGERAAASVAAAEPLWRKVPADFPIEIAENRMREFFPTPFAPLIVKYAERYSVDPRLVLAIMRQESRFEADAKSASAARGLMQFISSAATKTAADLGFDNFRQNDLYSPPTAILFGSHYLSQLAGQFQQQSEAVVASYNGGADNVKRWIARSRSNEADRFVAEIQFAQTKDYVQKVMASYRVYRELYDENLRPRFTNAS